MEIGARARGDPNHFEVAYSTRGKAKQKPEGSFSVWKIGMFFNLVKLEKYR